MHYATIFSFIAIVLAGILVIDFLWEGRKAFKAIALEHSGYMQDLETYIDDMEMVYESLLEQYNANLQSAMAEAEMAVPPKSMADELPITPAGKAHRHHNLNNDECVSVDEMDSAGYPEGLTMELITEDEDRFNLRTER